MSWFHLDPESIAARVRAGGVVAVPSPAASVARGVFGFTLVSVAGFSPWAVWGKALHRILGEAGLYAVCAIVFIGLSGPLLHRLIIGPGSLARFYKLFAITFATYSFAWIAGWMSLRGHSGGLAGLFAGTAIMGWMLATAFEARSAVLKVIAALFLLNTAGYFWVARSKGRSSASTRSRRNCCGECVTASASAPVWASRFTSARQMPAPC